MRYASVVIVAKAGDPRALELGERMAAWLTARGARAAVMENRTSAPQGAQIMTHAPDLVLALGGDGTMLSVARKLSGAPVPILGFNLGKVGFLTEVCPGSWEQALSTALDRGLSVCERMALAYRVLRGGEEVHAGRVINDIVVSRGALARLINLELKARNPGMDGAEPDEHLGKLRADGLILSTPTGSTGYAVSAGGPLMHPDMDAYSVTPICSFLGEFRPLCLPGDAHLEVTVLESRTEVYLTLDGQEDFALAPGDVVAVRRDPRGMRFACLEPGSYFAKLRAKGFVMAEGPDGEETGGPVSSECGGL